MSSIYRRILGSQLDRLPEPMRSFHDLTIDRQGLGEFAVQRATGFRGLVARLMGFPPSGNGVPLRLQVLVLGNRERWVRYFRDRRLITSQWKRGSLLVEASGPVRLGLQVSADENGLTHELRRWWLWFVPMPRWLAPGLKIVTDSRQKGWFVDVSISLPLIGQVVRYAGEVVFSFSESAKRQNEHDTFPSAAITQKRASSIELSAPPPHSRWFRENYKCLVQI